MPSQQVVDDIPSNITSLFQIASDAIAKTPSMLECRYREALQETISVSSSDDTNITDEDDVFHSCDSASLSSLDSMTNIFMDNVRVNKKLCSFNSDEQLNNYSLPLHFCFPPEICESLFNSYTKSLKEHSQFTTTGLLLQLRKFFTSSCLPLRNVSLQGLIINDQVLGTLLVKQHLNLETLDIKNIRKESFISVKTNKFLEKHDINFPKLTSLSLNCLDLMRKPSMDKQIRQTFYTISNRSRNTRQSNLPVLGEDALEGTALNCYKDDEINKTSAKNKNAEFKQFLLRCPELMELTLHNNGDFQISDESWDDFLEGILYPLKKLTTLDISYWQSLQTFNFIKMIPNLTTLILFDVRTAKDNIDNILQLKKLKHLDISVSNPEMGTYIYPVATLDRIIKSLIDLEYLDISQTNLPETPQYQEMENYPSGGIQSDIIGLRSLKKKLKFLGIYNCNGVANYGEIPAERVAGEVKEEQLITAMEIYQDRPAMLQLVFNESYNHYRFGNDLKYQPQALQYVISGLNKHLTNSALQIAGSAAMFYILRCVKMTATTKKKVIMALLDGMQEHMEEQVMVRNCCLSLCQFDIPSEVVFDYYRLAKLLVRVLKTHSSDQLTQRIVIFLLNSMACHVDGEQKIQVGELGAIEVILEQIKKKQLQNQADDIMEVSWSFLWNITDETPLNCERFLKADGLSLFRSYYRQFSNEVEVVRNMMGLIGNIAEVKHLRHYMMKDEYIDIFCLLLDTISDGIIEISYNSAGVLSHLISDGEEAFYGLKFKREDVMKKVDAAIFKWNLKTRRFINYRSFKPILNLITNFSSPASQHWAIWALANLTTTDTHKYCSYIEKEEGIELLECVRENSSTPGHILKLLDVIFDNIKKWKSDISRGHFENSMEWEN
uniref:Zyg eleven-related protein 1 (projected from Caenorhabditis elegans ortholog zer-1) n=1 Tax=Strongyloides venezuelensis TaxID=75913 RepID=A0A0K0F7S8_STRVS